MKTRERERADFDLREIWISIAEEQRYKLLERPEHSFWQKNFYPIPTPKGNRFFYVGAICHVNSIVTWLHALANYNWARRRRRLSKLDVVSSWSILWSIFRYACWYRSYRRSCQMAYGTGRGHYAVVRESVMKLEIKKRERERGSTSSIWIFLEFLDRLRSYIQRTLIMDNLLLYGWWRENCKKSCGLLV